MRNRQSGLSLVELMISITIGLVLMTGVVQMFLSTRTVFSTQQALARVQESGRMGVEFLSRDIRMAGFMGCMSRNMSMTNTLEGGSDTLYDFATGIEGVEGTSTGATVDTYITANPNTDILIVRSANGDGVGVSKDNNSSQIFLDDSGFVSGGCPDGSDMHSGLCAADIVVISDCEKARAFQITTINDTSGELNAKHAGKNDSTVVPGNEISSWGGSSVDPSENFGPDSEVIKVNTIFYYVANNTAGRPSLWRKVGNNSAEELLEGVEGFQLTYGRDTSGDNIPDSYQDADTITTAGGWGDVSSVRVQMLIQSTDDNVVPEPQSYTFAGITVDDPGDRKLRQVFVNTVGIRSRLP